MLKLFRSCVPGVLFGLLAVAAVSAADAQVTRLDKQLERLDVAVSGIGVITETVSGPNYVDQTVTEDASTTLGALVQVRYTKSPLLGVEFNYSYARFSENFSGSPFSGPSSATTPFDVQANASEYTVGYVAHLPTFLGFQPFAAVGAGTTAFKPTPNGGQGLPDRARATYYYDVGVEDQFSKFFGVRAQFRQTFYKAPDFGTNYLTINQQTITTEPSIGVYVKF